MSEVTIRDRWLGAVCYLSVLVFIPIFATDKSPFLARHCRQGFALFFAEVVAWLLLLMIEVSYRFEIHLRARKECFHSNIY